MKYNGVEMNPQPEKPSENNEKAVENAKQTELSKARKKSYTRILSIITGLTLAGIGVGYIGNIMEWWSGFTMFFNGWWTLFAIVPCLAGVLEYGFANAFSAGLIGGVLLLISKVGFFSRGWKLIIPGAILYFGLRLIFSSNPFGYRRIFDTDLGSSFFIPVYRSIVRQKEIKITEGFSGAELCAVFKPVTLDLREAKIRNDSMIYARAIFAPVMIVVNPDINLRSVRVAGTGKLVVEAANYSDIPDQPTLHINAECSPGSVCVRN